MTKCSRVSVAIAASLILASPPLRAQEAADQATARALFDEARGLVKAGKVADACPKFAAAAKLYASAGILLNLGDCYETIGRTASAWTEFGESAAAADRANRHDQAAEARRRQALLKPKLPRLTVVVPHEVAGMVVTRDETELAPAAWGSAIPVDSGTHRIRASAAGYNPWETSVAIATPGQTISVEVPALTPAPVAVAPPALAPEGVASGSAGVAVEPAPVAHRSHTVSYVLIGAGALVGIGGAVLMGIEAGRASSARSTDNASNDEATFRTTTAEFNSTKAPYYVGLGGAILGGAAAATGVVLFFTGRGGEPHASGGAVAPWMVAGGGGASVRASW